MKNPGFFYYPIRILITAKDRPVTLNTALPANLKEVKGIRAFHSGGINLYSRLFPAEPATIPRSIGWLCIEFNNRTLPLGNLDVTYDHNPLTGNGDDFLETAIPLTRNAIITGVYNNLFDPDVCNLVALLEPPKSWINYIVTIYLKCTKDHD